jgi:hypothetical protein
MNSNNQQVRRYWPHPLIMQSSIQYQDINNNVNLRNTVTKYFQEKLLKWIKKYPEFIKFKSMLNKINTDDGYKMIYKILRKFVKKTDLNWYDLRTNKELVKKYFISHL